jgi:predicted DNA-binding protein (UPF0251 family)
MLIMLAVPRPHCRRWISTEPAATLFKPAGIPLSALEEVAMTLDELEALRLADLEGLYQEEAAGRMGVSRPTFGRILESARRKAAEALALGKALRIEGGPVALARGPCRCPRCRHGPGQGTSQEECPRCRRGSRHPQRGVKEEP